MGRRPDTARFMPGVYVFPGGVVETLDYRIAVARDLAGDDRRLMRFDQKADARTLAICAIRETLEETGILCGIEGIDSVSGKDDVVGGFDDWRELVAGNRQLDLTRLRYLGRALTPPPSRIRFHASFFFTEVAIDQLPQTSSTELSDIRWVDIADHQLLPIAGVTRFMLNELALRLESPEPPESVPYYHFMGSEFIVERDYPTSTGTGLSEDAY
ncbi:MAG: hydrolase [marine bacterium B5-7]|nr:MAG: hydrolase [marine bacterium B5-7]